MVADMVDQSVASLMGELGKHMEGQLQAAVTANGTPDPEISIPNASTSGKGKGERW